MFQIYLFLNVKILVHTNEIAQLFDKLIKKLYCARLHVSLFSIVKDRFAKVDSCWARLEYFTL